jgi:adenylate cyclase
MTKLEFFSKLLTRHQGNAEEFDRELCAEHETTGTIMVCDSSGFTRITREKGVLHFLALLMQSYKLSIPVVKNMGGVLLKDDADNLIARFESPEVATLCASRLQQLHHERNQSVPIDEHFHICIGIDYGKFIKLDDDCFGDAVNIAYKLGEDVAEKGEILTTHSVASKLSSAIIYTPIGEREIGHVQTMVYRVLWQNRNE